MKKNLLKEKFFIGKKGYILNKSLFNEKDLNEVRNELQVIPFVGGDYGGEPEKPIKVYRENTSHLYVPKFYGLDKFGDCEININDGANINLEFKLELRKEQLIPVEKTLEAYKEKGGGILSLGCGGGKTIIGLYFISKLSKKTLIIVHKEFLMNQWIERIEFALPEARIGIIQGTKCNIEDKDIVIGMLQSLSLKEFPKDTFDDFGHVIIDECHRIPSKIFMRTLFKINCRYM